jgi:nitric oxide reductase NorE protein
MHEYRYQNQVTRHIPGEPGIWIFIFGDTLIFTVFFLIFLYHRGLNETVFVQSQYYLNQTLGVLNTLLMLTGSWFVASGIHAARMNAGRRCSVLFVMAVFCGAAFGAIKFVEYSAKFRAGITLNTNDFFMCYFMFTGIHFLHVLIGMALLSLLAWHSWFEDITPRKLSYLEIGASFWHLVDLLWIALFALLYLVK